MTNEPDQGDTFEALADELRSFVEEDARLLSELASVFEELRATQAAETFDADGIWSAVERTLWDDLRPHEGSEASEDPGR